MAMTALVKDELCRGVVPPAGARRAELCALLRFAGGAHVVAGQVVVQVQVAESVVAARLQREIYALYRYRSELQVLPARGRRHGYRYVVRVGTEGAALARQSGLLDTRGRPLRGLPARVVGGTLAEVEAVWRGAFLARGSVSEPGRTPALEIGCPSPETALALVGAARRIDIVTRAREQLVAVRSDGIGIAAVLSQMGAPDAARTWSKWVPVQAATRLTNFDAENVRRSTQAAEVAVARVERALDILDEHIPAPLAVAAQLRITHRQASLGELGALADPPLSKDAVYGRLRRLVALADRRTEQPARQ